MNDTTETRNFTVQCSGRLCKTRQTAEFTRGADSGDRIEWYATCRSCHRDLIQLTLS